ncbi:hypothetical protein KYC5002_19410 [Archangium violaceum]|uniref:hypothetical protein n=1 Tax=Archangium violaceum TaxID=83451 RepID=UPI002B2BF8BC|nr:hypothetical protein KYC5002_19410 [Archangium gephyra]
MSEKSAAQGNKPDKRAGLPLKHEELTRLKTELEIVEAQSMLATAKQPWWQSGRTVTTIVGLLSTILPVTSGIQSFAHKQAELATAQQTYQQTVRDRYLNTMLQQPEKAEVVLRFIEATTDDDKVRRWAENEKSFVDKEIELKRQHRTLYRKTIQVAARLAQSSDPQSESAALDEFWKLYKLELLEFESPEVEALMVLIGDALNECSTGRCDKPKLESLSYKLARQIKTELRQLDAANQAIKMGSAGASP